MDVLRGAGLGSGWQIISKIVDHVAAGSRRAAEAQKVAAESAEKHADAMERIVALERTPSQAMVAAKVDMREAQANLASYQAMLGVLARMGATQTPEQAKELASRQGALDVAAVKVAEMEKAERDRARAAVEAAKKTADAAKAEAERIAFTNQLRKVEAEAKQLEVAGERELAEQANTKIARMKAIADLGLNTESDARRRYALEADIAEAEKKGDTDLAKAKRTELDALREIAVQKEASLQQSMRAYLAEQAMAADKERREKAAAATRADFKKVDDSIQRDLNINRVQQADVENDPLRTDMEKLQDIIPLREAEIQLLEDRARLKKEQRDAATDPLEVQALQAEITRLNDEIAKLHAKPTARTPRINEVRKDARDMGVAAGGEEGNLDRSKHYATVGEGIEGGFLGYLTQLGTMADQIAAGIENTIGAAVDGITQGIMNWDGTARGAWQAIGQIGRSVLQSFLQTLVQMGVQWAVNAIVAKGTLFGIEATADTLRAARVAKENAAEASTLPAKTAGAAASGISSFGAALAFGLIAVALIASLAGGFAEGGFTGGTQRTKPAGVVHEGEWVAPQWLVGHPIAGPLIQSLEAMRTGAPGFSLGGFFKENLFYGLPKAFMPKIAKDYNPFEGRKFYGERRGEQAFSFDATTQDWVESMAQSGGIDQIARPYQGTAGGGGGSGSSGGVSQSLGSGRKINVAFLDSQRDSSVIEQMERDPNADTYFVHMLKKHRRHIGVTL
jgi:hypothetical protein